MIWCEQAFLESEGVDQGIIESMLDIIAGVGFKVQAAASHPVYIHLPCTVLSCPLCLDEHVIFLIILH